MYGTFVYVFYSQDIGIVLLYFLDIGIVLHVCIVLLNVLYFLDICIVRHAGCTVECFVLPRYLYCTDGYTVKCFVLLRYLFCTAYLLYC